MITLSDLSVSWQARRQREVRGYRERKLRGGEKRMGGIFGLVEKKGSGVFKGKGHWAMQPLCRDAKFCTFTQ